MIRIKRIYDPPAEIDGFRILVDRLWPRGIKKDAAHLDKWAKEIAPSTALRKQFNHKPEKWQTFKQAYTEELARNNAVEELLDDIRRNKTVTLLYGARDEEHNHAIVLQQFLKSHK